jgi:hypothetical protein
VAVISARNAWAVGGFGVTQPCCTHLTLVLHWNGRSWRHVSSPNPFRGIDDDNGFSGMAAISPANIWAVGAADESGGDRIFTLIEHWNGHSWKLISSPNPTGMGNGDSSNSLAGIAASSATSIWAVGWSSDFSPGPERPLVVHWNGKSWRHVPSPNPGGPDSDGTANILSGVTAVSARNVWTVGQQFTDAAQQTLIEHWNGTSWRRAGSPDPGGGTVDNVLSGVAAASATDIWAVGHYGTAALAIHGS